MAGVLWSRYPFVSADPRSRSWLSLLDNLGRSPATVDAYGRGLDQYFRFCIALGVDAADATLGARVAIRPSPSWRGGNPLWFDYGVSNATLQQRLTALRLSYDHLVYRGLRERNPVPRGSLPQRARAPMITLDSSAAWFVASPACPQFRRTTTGFAL